MAFPWPRLLCQSPCCCSLWPANTDRLDACLHATAHPIQPKVALSSAAFSLLKCVTAQVGWKSATKSDETISDTSSSCFFISISQSDPPAALQTEVKHINQAQVRLLFVWIVKWIATSKEKCNYRADDWLQNDDSGGSKTICKCLNTRLTTWIVFTSGMSGILYIWFSLCPWFDM